MGGQDFFDRADTQPKRSTLSTTMSSWADASEEKEEPAPLEQAPAEYTGGSGVRPRLQLKPRSAKAAQDHGGGGSSSIFGAAKPREQGE